MRKQAQGLIDIADKRITEIKSGPSQLSKPDANATYFAEVIVDLDDQRTDDC